MPVVKMNAAQHSVDANWFHVRLHMLVLIVRLSQVLYVILMESAAILAPSGVPMCQTPVRPQMVRMARLSAVQYNDRVVGWAVRTNGAALSSVIIIFHFFISLL